MRLCRIEFAGQCQAAFYDEARIIPLATAAEQYRRLCDPAFPELKAEGLLPFLPHGALEPQAQQLGRWLAEVHPPLPGIATEEAHILVPLPHPPKIILLAGNYLEHIKEQGGMAAERERTFPYLFMKPPSTTLNDPYRPVCVPRVAPAAVDWELELAVVIGRRCKNVPAAEALNQVAGYTIINDISQRKFRPNPQRQKRERDVFFDWLHGKWFDTFCPCGPCITSARSIADPQNLRLQLSLNGEIRQDGSTSSMIFSIADIIAFITQIMTLEPGDMISTGTPSGVGNATGTYLKAGDVMLGTIEQIGTLKTVMCAE